MRDLNIDFLDLYKRVDRFIRDAYSSNEGVSEYIRKMEINNYKGICYVQTWTSDYEKLKHLRWIRNQLAHEVGYDSDICEESDYVWLESFYQHLFSAEDPLAVMVKQENAERQHRIAEQRQRQMSMQKKQYQNLTPVLNNKLMDNKPERKLTLWEKIKKFFFGL